MRVITYMHITEADAILHKDFFVMNTGSTELYLVDKKHPDFETYRSKAIANAERLSDVKRIEKYKSY